MKRIAVIGSGISGLSAAYYLSRKHEVHVFERENRLGGHTHTVMVDSPTGQIPVDTGFVVHNNRTYPNFCRSAGFSSGHIDGDERCFMNGDGGNP